MAEAASFSRRETSSSLRTPALVYDETTLVADATEARAAVTGAGGHLFYAMKACAFIPALKRLAGLVDGFHASSLFEARLGREILGPNGLIHVTSPSFAEAEMEQLCALSDMISLNSLGQWDRFRKCAGARAQIGLRVNPEQSFVPDERYDPCRRHSKLGAPVSVLNEVARSDPERLQGLKGLLVHSNSESIEFGEILTTVRQLDHKLGPLLGQLEWVNLGGGYLFREGTDLAPLNEAIALLTTKYGLRVYTEPGTSIIKRAGRLVSTVMDVFESGGKSVAVLDTSVNHLPEVFEYQFEAEVEGDLQIGGHPYILTGATCLAGDLFGEFGFAEPVAPGARVVIKEAGAYSMVKASMFNGVNLPFFYWQNADGACELVKSYTYDDFKARCGG